MEQTTVNNNRQKISQSEFNKRVTDFLANPKIIAQQKAYVDKVVYAMIMQDKPDTEIDARVAEIESSREENARDFLKRQYEIVENKKFEELKKQREARLKSRNLSLLQSGETTTGGSPAKETYDDEDLI